MGQRLQEGWGRSTVQEIAGRETEREEGIERKGESEDEESSGRKGASFPSVCTCGGSTPSRLWHVRMTRIKPRGSTRERALRGREFPPSSIDRSATDQRLQLIDRICRFDSVGVFAARRLQSWQASEFYVRLQTLGFDSAFDDDEAEGERNEGGCAGEEIAISQSQPCAISGSLVIIARRLERTNE